MCRKCAIVTVWCCTFVSHVCVQPYRSDPLSCCDRPHPPPPHRPPPAVSPAPSPASPGCPGACRGFVSPRRQPPEALGWVAEAVSVAVSPAVVVLDDRSCMASLLSFPPYPPQLPKITLRTYLFVIKDWITT